MHQKRSGDEMIGGGIKHDRKESYKLSKEDKG